MSGWLYEGIAFYAAFNPLDDHVPLYRAWNGTDHFYTTNKGESKDCQVSINVRESHAT